MEKDKRDSTGRSGNVLADLGLVCVLLTGFIGLGGSFYAVLNGSFSASGIYLLSAALAFGLFTNAVFRR